MWLRHSFESPKQRSRYRLFKYPSASFGPQIGLGTFAVLDHYNGPGTFDKQVSQTENSNGFNLNYDPPGIPLKYGPVQG